MKIKYVFFDCWDTVIHYQTKEPHSELKQIYKHIKNPGSFTFENFCLDKEAFMKDYYRDTKYDVSVEALIRFFAEYKGFELDCSFEQAADDMVKGYEDKTIDGVEDFASFLTSKGVHFSILSNTVLTQKQTEWIINEAWPKNKFDLILASSYYGVKKPNKLFFELGANKVGQKTEDCIFIGDNIFTDIAGASKAGMKPFYFNWKQHTPSKETLDNVKDFVEFRSYKELEKILSNSDQYEF